MLNPIKEIYKWQVDAGLANQPYKDELESSFQIEEALEGFEFSTLDYVLNGDESTAELTAKQMSRDIIDKVYNFKPLSDVDRFDKAIDAIVFAIGSMSKLGLNPQQIQRGLLAVNKANMQKLHMPVDELGKKIKPEGFTGPEPELQKILDERE